MTLVVDNQSAPTHQAALSFLTTTTTPRLRADFKSGVLGEPEFYMLRSVNTRVEVGPWLDVATATVAAKALWSSTRHYSVLAWYPCFSAAA